MLPFSRILVPVDFSDRCLGMMRYVKAMAAKYGSEVTLLHVVNPFYAIPPTAMSGPVMIPVPQSHMAEKGKQLDEFAVGELRGLKVRRLVYEGDPASQIATFAKAEDIQLIAMPTHGYGVMRRFLIGSDTAKVLHDVSCPVLTGIHMEERTAPGAVKFPNILCALDLGPQSQETLTCASRLAADFHSTLAIIHALTPIDPGIVMLLSSDFSAKREEAARQEVEKLQRKAAAGTATISIQEGETAKTVCSLAKSMGADLLVIGRGAQDGLTGRLRTNAYAIIRQSPCAVISV